MPVGNGGQLLLDLQQGGARRGREGKAVRRGVRAAMSQPHKAEHGLSPARGVRRGRPASFGAAFVVFEVLLRGNRLLVATASEKDGQETQ